MQRYALLVDVVVVYLVVVREIFFVAKTTGHTYSTAGFRHLAVPCVLFAAAQHCMLLLCRFWLKRWGKWIAVDVIRAELVLGQVANGDVQLAKVSGSGEGGKITDVGLDRSARSADLRTTARRELKRRRPRHAERRGVCMCARRMEMEPTSGAVSSAGSELGGNCFGGGGWWCDALEAPRCAAARKVVRVVVHCAGGAGPRIGEWWCAWW